LDRRRKLDIAEMDAPTPKGDGISLPELGQVARYLMGDSSVQVYGFREPTAGSAKVLLRTIDLVGHREM
jgi:hypothetical protein